MFDPSGQLAGLASKTLSMHAFWIVVKRDGSCSGSATRVLPMFAWPGPEVTLTVRLAPLALLVLACVDAVKVGLNGSLAQSLTWKLEPTFALVPCDPVSVASILSGLQLV